MFIRKNRNLGIRIRTNISHEYALIGLVYKVTREGEQLFEAH